MINNEESPDVEFPSEVGADEVIFIEDPWAPGCCFLKSTCQRHAISIIIMMQKSAAE